LRPLSYRHKPEKLPLYARPEAAAFLAISARIRGVTGRSFGVGL